jgi:flagellar L-ring protein precursor FlgH
MDFTMDSKRLLLMTSLLLVVLFALPASALFKTKKDDGGAARNAYIHKVQQASGPLTAERTLGSLWSPGAPLTEVAADFKAVRLNDTVIIQVVEQTSAQTSGTSAQNRSYAATSGITGLGGHVSTGGVNTIVNASSSEQLKGAGSIAANSNLSTSLTGQVVSVLPNGNLVVEAQRLYHINGQHDTVIVRGVVRPGDINSGNTILSTQLMNLEVELKGKGLVSDGTRGPNLLTRIFMKIFGF